MKVTIKWYTPGGGTTREVEAYDCGVPGLVIFRDPEAEPPCFIINHLRSGLSVCHFSDPEAALAGAQAIAGLCDWTLSGTQIARRLHGTDVLDAVYDLGGCIVARPAGDRSDIAAVTS